MSMCFFVFVGRVPRRHQRSLHSCRGAWPELKFNTALAKLRQHSNPPSRPSHLADLLWGRLAPFVGYVAASAQHFFSSFRSQAMQPPPPSPVALRKKAAAVAVESDGGKNESADQIRAAAHDAP
jgi:hypothetical protein